MKQKNLIEVIVGSVKILEERKNKDTGDVEIDIFTKFQQADKININNRLYPRAILEREIDKIADKIANEESVWGLAFHPADGIGKPSNISHRWESVTIEESGECFGTLTILATTEGKEIQTILKSGGKLGLSSRGTGTLTEKEKIIDGKKTKYLEVNNDYKMTTPGDFVLAPAVPDAQASIPEQIQILESQLNDTGTQGNKKEELNVMRNKNGGLKKETLESLMWIMYNRDTEPDALIPFKGSFLEWKAKYEDHILAVDAVDRGEAETVAEALVKMGKADKAKKLKVEEGRQQRVEAKDVYMEAKIMGVDPVKYAERINANIAKEEEVDADLDFSPEEVKALLAEATASGVDVGDEKVRAKVLDTARKLRKRSKEIKLDEENRTDFEKKCIAFFKKEDAEKEKRSLLLREKMLAGEGGYFDKKE